MRKSVFTIHPGRKIVVALPKEKPRSNDGTFTFSNERELRKIAADWPGARLLEIWNQLPGVKKIIRFKDRATAIRRIWTAVQNTAPGVVGLALACPPDATKAARIVALLKCPTGAALQTIMDLTGWQAHSVRGFISGQLSKRMGYRIQSFKRDGERIYRIRT